MVDDSSGDRDPVEVLAEEFMERLRQGEHPSIAEYKSRYPHLAEDIEDIFPALAMMDEIDPSAGELSRSQPAADDVLPKLAKLGDFRIIREVGRGGMGVVYEAEQVSLGRHVALKVLPASALPDSKHVRRFEREARSAAKLHHTNIVPVFGVGEQDGMHYYVMQFIQGLPLDEVVDELKKIQAQPTGAITSSMPMEKTGTYARQHSAAEVAHSLMAGQFAETQIVGSDSGSDASLVEPESDVTSSSVISESLNLSEVLSGSTLQLGKSGVQSTYHRKLTYWESVANIGIQVADALQYAHEQRILHRDIKPSNLLLDLRGTTWVTDFGLAKATDQHDITHTGDILGTLRYMPPEAFEGAADARSDVYALGLTLYELLAFQPAFGRKDRNQLIKQVTTESAPRLDKLNPQIPRDLVTIVHKAIDRDPAHRYQTAEALEQDLQRFLDDEPIKARRVSLLERLSRWSRRNKGLSTSIGVVALLLLVINIAGPILTWKLRESKNSLASTVTDLRKTEANLREARDKAEQQASQEVLLRTEAEQAREGESAQRAQAQRQAYAADMRAAQAALAYNRNQTVTLLEQHIPKPGEPDLRGIEWRYLWQAARGDEVLTWKHPGMVPGAEFSPDGKQVATACFDGFLRVFDVDSGKLQAEYHRNVIDEEVFVSFCYSPDGTTLATSSRDGIVILDRTDLQVRRTLEVNDSELNSIQRTSIRYSPDGQWLAVLFINQSLRVWDTTNWESFQLPVRKNGRFTFSPDSKAIYLGRSNQFIERWELATRHRAYLKLDFGDKTIPPTDWFCVESSPNGDWMVLSGFDGTVVAADALSGEILWEEKAHRSRVYALDVSHDGRWFASGGFDQLIHIWDAETREKVMTLKGHLNEIWSLKFSPDDRYLLTSGKDGAVKIWDTQSKPVSDSWLLESGESPIGYSPHNKGLITLAADQRTVRHWNGPDVVQSQTCDVSLGNSLYSSKSRSFYTRRNPKQVEARSAETLELKRDFSLSEPCNGLLQISPDERWIAGLGEPNSELQVWDTASGEPVFHFPNLTNSASRHRAEFSPDSRYLGYGTDQWEIQILDIIQKEVVKTLGPFPWRVYTVSFSSDNRLIAGSSWAGDIRIYEIQSGQELKLLEGHGSGVHAHSFFDEGRTLVSAGDDASVRFWNVPTGRETLIFPNMWNRFYRIPFVSPAGDLLVFLDMTEDRVRVHRLPTFREINTARQATFEVPKSALQP